MTLDTQTTEKEGRKLGAKIQWLSEVGRNLKDLLQNWELYTEKGPAGVLDAWLSHHYYHHNRSCGSCMRCRYFVSQPKWVRLTHARRNLFIWHLFMFCCWLTDKRWCDANCSSCARWFTFFEHFLFFKTTSYARQLWSNLAPTSTMQTS